MLTPMALLDDLQRLSDLRSSGALSDAEFSAAKQRILATSETDHSSSDGSAIGSNVAEKLLLDAKLARLDREFERVRQSLMVRSANYHHGYMVEPSRVSTVTGIISIVVLIALCTFIGSMPNGRLGGFVIVPIIAIITIILYIVANERRLAALTEARDKYQTARSRIISALARMDRP
jgi:uncharacterized membrane protein